MKTTRHLVLLAASLLLASPATAQPVPNSIAALGDSITRGYNACPSNGDCLDLSWATGTNWYVNPHYLRLRTHNWRITAQRFVNAKNGVKVSDLNRQAGLAVAQGAEYVTILIGTNDACALSMTATSTFRARFEDALETLATGLPTASIFVASIPDWHQVWTVAQSVSHPGGCASMAAAPDEAARLAVRDRIVEYNAILADVCSEYPATCRFDGNAVFDHAFSLAELSGDRFHPNHEGQKALSALTYAAGFGWSEDVNPWQIGPVEWFFHPGTVRKIDQITGNTDGTLGKPTKTQTGDYRINGTDLGTSFEHDGKVYFLFGDTQGGLSAALDSFAYTTSTDPFAFTLTIPTMPSDPTRFQPIAVPDALPGTFVESAGFCVPTGGVSRPGDGIYMVYATDCSAATETMERSVLARSTDDGMTWSYLFDLSKKDAIRGMADAHFINASLSLVDFTSVPGLTDGEYLVLFGSGEYRRSSVYLAVIPTANVTAGAVRYFAGLAAGAPTWTADQAEAVPLIDEEVVGELFARRIPELGNDWVLTYQGPGASLVSGGVLMRTAAAPWGPFSAREVIFDTIRDDAIGHFVHDPTCTCDPWLPPELCTLECDDFGEGDEAGGIYGPYLIPSFTTTTAGGIQLYYTLSTWNPYDVVLVRSEVGASPPPENPVSSSDVLTLGDGSWSKSPGAWYSAATFTDGATGVKTGAPEKGVMARWLPRDPWNRSLSFQVTGGDAEVLLLEGSQPLPPTTGTINATFYNDIKAETYGRVVQATWGHKDGTEVPITWDLRPFDRMHLKVVVIDHRTTTWGYVQASHLRLDRNAPSIGTPECGDSVQNQSEEECDDGNLADGDGCDSNCTLTRCGNGIVAGDEQCDEGATPDDCCSSSCQPEPLGTVCRAITGACDLAESCDGLSSACPADGFEPDGTTCNDGKSCTSADQCAAGACAGTCNTGVACSEVCGGTCGGPACTCQ